jgi:hypothetical protein
MTQFTQQIVEAAMCFWEAMLDARSEGTAPPWLEELWWGEGTSAMRMRKSFSFSTSACSSFKPFLAFSSLFPKVDIC